MPNIIQFPSEFDAINERCMTGEQRQAAREALDERHYAEERERLENGRAAMSFEPETFAALVDYLASKKQPTQNAEGVHVGDLFYCSWGYEQTNIDYFQVVALRARILRCCGKSAASTSAVSA